MFAEEALKEIEQWRRQAKSPHHQLDWRWIERYRELSSYDSHWWLTWAGPFAQEEQQHWNFLSSQALDATTKEQFGKVMSQSRKRELAAALAEQREPHLHYPALDGKEVCERIAAFLELDAEVSRDEPNALVRKLYHEAITQEEVYFLRLIEATYEGNTERFWEFNRLLNPMPSAKEVNYAFSHVLLTISQGLLYPETVDISQQLTQFLSERLHLSIDLSCYAQEVQDEVQQQALDSITSSQGKVSATGARRFFETVLRESGYDGWRVVVDPNASAPRIEQGLRQLFLPDTPLSIERIRHYVSHEIAGHVARCAAGEHSPLGLLGIHTRNSLPTEEGLALYHERRVAILHGQTFDDAGIWQGTLTTGLAIGVITPPQTFLPLYAFFELFFLLRRHLRKKDEDIQIAHEKARAAATARCLRTYRGVPDLTRAGVCYLKDALYLHGLWMIERAVAQDEAVLEQLSVGVVALENIPDLQELGISIPPQPLRQLAYDPHLDSYILSFESSEGNSEERT